MSFNSSPEPPTLTPPRWQLALLEFVLMHGVFVGVPLWFTYEFIIGGAFVPALIALLGAEFGFKNVLAKSSRQKLLLSLQLWREIVLTRRIKRVLKELDPYVAYINQDVTTGHELKVMRTKLATYIRDPTGIFIFDNRTVGVWMEDWETESLAELLAAKPASTSQLLALIHRMRTYR